jgi:ubiquitin-protein ligase
MKGSVYENGTYHGKILLDPEYPKKAPRISLLTHSGRWEINKDICLSGMISFKSFTLLLLLFSFAASNYHQELWNPNWNLRTLVLSLRGFMTTNPREIGSVEASASIRKELALESREYICPECGLSHNDLFEMSEPHLSESTPSTSVQSPVKKVFFTGKENILEFSRRKYKQRQQRALDLSKKKKNKFGSFSLKSLLPFRANVLKLITFSLWFSFFFLIRSAVTRNSFGDSSHSPFE